MADANVKLCHYKNCGQSQNAIQPTRHHFFGEPAGALHAQLVDGSPPMTASNNAAVGSHADTPVCTASIHADRPTAPPGRAEVDRTGVASLSCPHGCPIPGTMVDMARPEHYAVYDAAILQLLRVDPSMAQCVVYLDIACRYRPHWRNLVDKLVSEGHSWVEPSWRDLCIVLPWWHARGHDETCQVIHSAVYCVSGAALRPAV